MRAVVQRVREASVTVDGRVVGKIGPGLVILLGVRNGDDEETVRWMVEKIINLRIFTDDDEKMNWSLKDVDGEILAVSQFTLCASVKKGRRPSFDQAAPPDVANALYARFVELVREAGVSVETGVFQAHMEVALVNDGPVTIIVDNLEGKV